MKICPFYQYTFFHQYNLARSALLTMIQKPQSFCSLRLKITKLYPKYIFKNIKMCINFRRYQGGRGLSPDAGSREPSQLRQRCLRRLDGADRVPPQRYQKTCYTLTLINVNLFLDLLYNYSFGLKTEVNVYFSLLLITSF